ncbi:SapC family protein [Thalassotalea euphylliae]|uniref:SapC family protein n=1 Tax=Thalassotalea euphylliae TaxID=1655234 RepID=UPI00363950D4
MPQLHALNSKAHGALKVVDNADLLFAKSNHILPLRVSEVGQASTSFPVFLMKDGNSGLWRLTVVTSFERGSNLFVADNQWHANYKPTAMQAFPFFLMNAEGEQQGYTVGIDPESPAFSSTSGDTIFDSKGNANEALQRATSLLQADIQNDIQTYQFGKAMAELDLCRSIDIVLQKQDGSTETIQGLCTIDQDKFNTLSIEQLAELREKGYLMPIHAMLMSVFQLNALVRLSSTRDDVATIAQVKLSATKAL